MVWSALRTTSSPPLLVAHASAADIGDDWPVMRSPDALSPPSLWTVLSPGHTSRVGVATVDVAVEGDEDGVAPRDSSSDEQDETLRVSAARTAIRDTIMDSLTHGTRLRFRHPLIGMTALRQMSASSRLHRATCDA